MEVEAIVGVVALVMAIACVLSGLYCWNVYRQRHEEALFLTRLVVRNVRVSLAAAVVAFLVAYSYINEPLPRPWGAIITGSALIVFMYGPISDALLWRKERKTKVAE